MGKGVYDKEDEKTGERRHDPDVNDCHDGVFWEKPFFLPRHKRPLKWVRLIFCCGFYKSRKLPDEEGEDGGKSNDV